MSPSHPERFRLVASFIAGRALDITEAPAGQSAHTNGRVVLVSAGASVEQQRREVLVQSALLGAGSVDARLLKRLRGRPSVARRYLALEGRRVLRDLADRLPAIDVDPDEEPTTATADESLNVARTRKRVSDAPPWFGALRPSLLLASAHETGLAATDNDLRLELTLGDPAEGDDEDDPAQKSRILRIFETPVTMTDAVANFLRKIMGGSRSEGSDSAGGEMQIRSVRRARSAGLNARPLPTPIRFTDDGKPGAAFGIGGAWYPEWDVFDGRYRPEWCRVIEFPLTSAADVSAAGVTQDDMLRRRLSRVGLAPKILRARPDGDELDLEALIDLFVDLRSGFSPPENLYVERRKLARDLGVLILLDASGSANDSDAEGLAVHDHQRRAAATLAVTLDELGDRVAVYAFRSHGRRAVHLPAIKTFDQRFGAAGRARLNQLEPSGYTRLGAGIRGAGEILKTRSGTPKQLLLVLSDGFPYDEGYEGRYAEADARKALEELRADGVACLCLSIGASTETGVLERVFGSTSFAGAAALSDLSPQMDELFLGALRELAAPG
ncbi:nitric oxide reductase activation protein NorD [Mycolicibacterium gadium]|uniref:VWA domain-containing protein n=1 Tax=Mycolicibacterium gadium TaxID=1794 RepID=A0ABT6GRS2_MYCGU|nr:VWA domain-containing protein [Mycolicibacterium gadium]MDG5483928.1 VWA domain-containing protein [Mycolicibacterium gadium]